MADVADDRLVAHPFHVFEGDDVAVARAGDEDIALGQRALDGLHLEALHRGLQRTDRIDLGDDHPRAVGLHRAGAALAHVAVAADDRHLAGDHHVRGPLDAVGQRFAAAVEVVELRFGTRVVDVDRRHEQFARRLHLVEPVYARGRLLAYAAPFGHRTVPLRSIFGKDRTQRSEDHGLLVRRGGVIERRGVVLGLVALVDQQSCIAAVVDDQVGPLAARERERHGRAPPIFFQRLALPREDRHAGFGDGCRSVILRREDVARAPAHVSTQFDERLDEHRRLDRHVQRPHHPHPAKRFLRAVFAAHRHQAGHFVLRDLDLLTPPFGQRQVGDLVGNRFIQIHRILVFSLIQRCKDTESREQKQTFMFDYAETEYLRRSQR